MTTTTTSEASATMDGHSLTENEESVITTFIPYKSPRWTSINSSIDKPSPGDNGSSNMQIVDEDTVMLSPTASPRGSKRKTPPLASSSPTSSDKQSSDSSGPIGPTTRRNPRSNRSSSTEKRGKVFKRLKLGNRRNSSSLPPPTRTKTPIADRTRSRRSNNSVSNRGDDWGDWRDWDSEDEKLIERTTRRLKQKDKADIEDEKTEESPVLASSECSGNKADGEDKSDWGDWLGWGGERELKLKLAQAGIISSKSSKIPKKSPTQPKKDALSDFAAPTRRRRRQVQQAAETQIPAVTLRQRSSPGVRQTLRVRARGLLSAGICLDKQGTSREGTGEENEEEDSSVLAKAGRPTKSKCSPRPPPSARKSQPTPRKSKRWPPKKLPTTKRIPNRRREYDSSDGDDESSSSEESKYGDSPSPTPRSRRKRQQSGSDDDSEKENASQNEEEIAVEEENSVLACCERIEPPASRPILTKRATPWKDYEESYLGDSIIVAEDSMPGPPHKYRNDTGRTIDDGANYDHDLFECDAAFAHEVDTEETDTDVNGAYDFDIMDLSAGEVYASRNSTNNRDGNLNEVHGHDEIVSTPQTENIQSTTSSIYHDIIQQLLPSSAAEIRQHIQHSPPSHINATNAEKDILALNRELGILRMKTQYMEVSNDVENMEWAKARMDGIMRQLSTAARTMANEEGSPKRRRRNGFLEIDLRDSIRRKSTLE